MRHRLFLANMSMLLLLSAACGDRMGRPIPGMQDSLHYFNRADYKIIHKLPDSVGFRIRSMKVEGEFKDRLILEVAKSKALDGYCFPIICKGENNNGKTVKPTQVNFHEGTKAGAMLDKRLKYIIYGAGSVYTRLYLRLPGQDRVLFELPVRWKTKKNSG